jgi:N-terminal domain of anti-restriction factor ArdC
MQCRPQWQRWVRVRSRNGLARYSVNNQLLIALARPDATFVAGFGSWLELGYHVRKGEKAIWILAPLKIKEHDRVSGEDTGETRILFRAVPVFDLAQVTAGEHATPLAPPAEPFEDHRRAHSAQPSTASSEAGWCAARCA